MPVIVNRNFSLSSLNETQVLWCCCMYCHITNLTNKELIHRVRMIYDILSYVSYVSDIVKFYYENTHTISNTTTMQDNLNRKWSKLTMWYYNPIPIAQLSPCICHSCYCWKWEYMFLHSLHKLKFPHVTIPRWRDIFVSLHTIIM
jgi:hypothetical protein